MPKYTCKIQESWFLIEKYKGWLCKVDGDDATLFYSACQTSFDIQNIRKSAIESHFSRVVHQKKFAIKNSTLKTIPTITSFFAKSNPSPQNKLTAASRVSTMIAFYLGPFFRIVRMIIII